MRRMLFGCALLAASPASADIVPVADRSDPRVLVADYIPGAAIRVEVALGQKLTVLLPPNDMIMSVDAEARSDWQIQVDQEKSDTFTLTPLRPVADSQASVQTKSHTYLFTLSSEPSADAPLYLRVVVPGQAKASAASKVPGGTIALQTSWKLTGNRELMPSSIRDDGSKIYLEWSDDQAIPAVLAIDRLKREEMVNGYMRGSVFTIDRIYDHLIFRLDKVSAEARRKPVKQR